MHYLTTIIPLILLGCCLSCTGIRDQTRNGKDLSITQNNSELLKGCNSPNMQNAQFLHHLLTNRSEQNDTPFNNYNVCLTPIDKKHILVKLQHDSSTLSTSILKGRYREGYFQIRRWKTKMIVGPLVWSLTDQLTCIGISKENKLVVIYTTGGQLLFVFFPFIAGHGPDVVHEFDWARK